MGSSPSKVARKLPTQNAASRMGNAATAAAAAASPRPHPRPASVHPSTVPSFEKSEGIINDAKDPDFDSMLQSLGAVQHGNNPSTPQPNMPTPATSSRYAPTQTPSQRTPTSLRIMQSREQELDSQEADPTAYLTVFTIREVLKLRGKGMRDADIARTLNVKVQTVTRLGRQVADVRMRTVDEEKQVIEFVN